MNEYCIAVVGAGTIGADVALDFALHGHSVWLKDVSTEKLEAATAKMKSTYRLTRLTMPRTPLAPLEDALKRIRPTTDNEGVRTADLVVENVTESFNDKKKVYLELGPLDRGGTIYAANTSCISITKIAALMPAPERVIGMHFMNPVPSSRIVELIRGHATSEETITKARGFVQALGKNCIVANDMPGFVSNRVMMLMINESIWLLQDGVASAPEIDVMFRQGFGHKMGPLATADLIGLDTILNSIGVLYESYKDCKFRPCPLLVKMVDAGLLGRKSGRGFFTY
jgi:3-hydroxybutyryl-CoA dehydrogenase